MAAKKSVAEEIERLREQIREHEYRYYVLDAPVTRVGSLDVPVPFSPRLEDAVLPNADKIYRTALDVLEY